MKFATGNCETQPTRRAITGGGLLAILAGDLLHAQAKSAPPASAITNLWGKTPAVSIRADHTPVFRGRAGAGYNHHPQVLFFHGQLYATWSCGDSNEDDPGQRMMLAISKDGGKTWSEPRRISPMFQHPRVAHTSMGLRAYKDTLIAYFGRHEWNALGLDAKGHRLSAACYLYRDDPSRWVHRDVWTEAMTSRDEGATWNKSERIIDRFVPNLRPFPLANGRLVITGNVTFPYTDDPSGLSGWKRAGLPRLPPNAVDDPEGFHKVASSRGDAYDYCEASFFQTSDAVIHMMLRTNASKRGDKAPGLLAVTESRDNGVTWSEPRLTGYTDSTSRFHFGRLPDGRYFGLSCPAPRSARTPMVLAASRDGVVFDRHYTLGDELYSGPRAIGVNKGGLYGYPSFDMMGDKMCVLYSRNKEDISFCSFSLGELT